MTVKMKSLSFSKLREGNNLNLFKVNQNIWQELIYLINNFFSPLVYTKGRDIYTDRVTLVRSKEAEKIFEPQATKNVEYFTLNARSKEMSKSAILQKREIVEKVVTDSIFANEMLNSNKEDESEIFDYIPLFDYVQKTLSASTICDYEKLNNFIVEAYKKLDLDDAIRVASFRESAILKCVQYNLISQEFAEQEIGKFPNSTLKLQANLKVKDKEMH